MGIRTVTRRGFLSRAALTSMGVALAVVAPSVRSRRADAAEVDHIVNGSFEDDPAGAAPTGWSTIAPTV